MTKQEIIKRLKSLLWRASMVALTFGVNYLVENISGVGLDQYSTMSIGLVLGEVSKYLNNKYSVK